MKMLLVLILLYSFVASAVADYNVRDYGAKGDGATDDTVAIQSAIDSADNAGGDTVFFPKGSYVTADLVVGSGNTLANHRTSHVYLEGAAHHAAAIKYNGTGTAIRFNMVIGGGLRRLDILNSSSIRGGTIGVETSGPSGGSGTYTHDCIFAEVTIGGFHYGWKTSSSDSTSTSSEITSINLTLNDCDIGFYNFQFNGLDFTFIQLQMARCGIGLDAQTAAAHVFGGSASNDGLDFKFRNGGTNGVYDFRSETAGTFVDASANELVISGCNVEPTAGVAVLTASQTQIISSSIKGDVSLYGGGSVTISASQFGRTAVLVGSGGGYNLYDIRGSYFLPTFTHIANRSGIYARGTMFDSIVSDGAPFPNPHVNTTINGSGANGSSLKIPNLPISDPHNLGQLWNNSGVVMVSGG